MPLLLESALAWLAGRLRPGVTVVQRPLDWRPRPVSPSLARSEVLPHSGGRSKPSLPGVTVVATACMSIWPGVNWSYKFSLRIITLEATGSRSRGLSDC
jgi:hypothetical protein